MRKTIELKRIGQLTQIGGSQDCWKSKEIEIPFFDNHTLPISMDFQLEQDKTFIAEADEALENFFKLVKTDREEISHLAYKNCLDFLQAVGFDEVDEELKQIKNEHEIWKFIHPTGINVSRRPYGDKDIYIQIACECDWEQEHGLQLIFRRGKKLTRISSQDGHLTEADAYGKPDEEDELLSKF